jgi:hypothetical protein
VLLGVEVGSWKRLKCETESWVQVAVRTWLRRHCAVFETAEVLRQPRYAVG